MTKEELYEKLNTIQENKCETNTLEVKAARSGCPKRLYDTLSSFSNQDDGGVIIFGVDEENDYEECGVYDPQDLQKKINEQCLQMEPKVRPLLTVLRKDNKVFVAAEIPGIDISDRPCFYQGKGRLKGSYVRIGDSDEPMNEYEIYSYEAFRRKYKDDIRIVDRATYSMLDNNLLDEYYKCLKREKPNLAALPNSTINELLSITREQQITLSAVMLFCNYPQAFFPQLCVTAVTVPGNSVGDIGEQGERFGDNQRIEGTIPEMLDKAIEFVQRNMRIKTIVDPETGKRQDRTDYPITAVREAVLNALVHRDYSLHTEGMPIQIIMFSNRMEIISPGGLYGRISIDQLGKVQPDTRNPVIVTALEVLGETENRYSGIPSIYRSMKEYGLRPPEFEDQRGTFKVILYNSTDYIGSGFDENVGELEDNLLDFLIIPRTRQEIADHLKINTVNYAIHTYVNPLVEKGIVKLEIPEKPRSHRQRYYSVKRNPGVRPH